MIQNESGLILDLWDVIRDHVPHQKRVEIVTAMLLIMQDHDVDIEDMKDIVGEDPYLTYAFHELFGNDMDQFNEYDQDGE